MEILLSTGTFTGRINGRDYRLLLRFHSLFNCDGFEFMIFDEFYPYLSKIVEEYVAEGIKIPIMHFDKDIGNGICSESEKEFDASLEKLKINVETAAKLNAKKAVLHLWGSRESDKNCEIIYNRVKIVSDYCQKNDIIPLYENIFCVYGSPLRHLEILSEKYPEISFIIDSRPAQFHGELERTLDSPIMKKARHLHINDYLGGYMEWEKINPIVQPGKGNICWQSYFSALKKIRYNDTITLEAPSHLPNGVDEKTLNSSLDFIRRNTT